MGYVQQMPESVKNTFDVMAFLASTSALVGLLTNVVGLIGAILGTVWAGYRLIDYLKNRK
jgi:hypothetical protein